MFDYKKYVVTRWSGGDETIFLFPPWVEHSKFARFFGATISAGFVDMETKTCLGESVSLNIKSRYKEDTELLRNFLNPEGK